MLSRQECPGVPGYSCSSLAYRGDYEFCVQRSAKQISVAGVGESFAKESGELIDGRLTIWTGHFEEGGFIDG